MEGAVSWIKSIACYVILISLLQGILPDNRYKKYVQLFTGLVLMLLILSPMLQLRRQDQTLADAFHRYAAGMLKQDVRDADGDIRMEGYYEGEIRQLLAPLGYGLQRAQIRFNEAGQVAFLRIWIRPKAEETEAACSAGPVEEVRIGGREKPQQEQMSDAVQALLEQQYGLKEGTVQVQLLF